MLGWVLACSMLLSQAAGAWHSVAHAAEPVAVASLGQAAPARNSTWLDALFAYHLKGHGHAACVSFDHMAHAHGLPVVMVALALPAVLGTWQMPALSTTARADLRRPFDARAPPVLI